MSNKLKKRGQKIVKRFSRFSEKAKQESKEHIKENFIGRLSHIRQIRLLVIEWVLLMTILILLAIAQSFWFTDSYSVNTYIAGGTYTEGTLDKVNSMNPLFATTSSEKTLSSLLFARLISIDYSGNPNGSLVHSIRSTDNGKVWTITLRENLKWSDNEPITNDDVVFTINLIKNPVVNSIYSSNFASVKVSENEDHEIVFTLPSPYADFSSALNVPILPKHILENADPKTLVEHQFSTKPVTSGAFTYNATQVLSDEGEKVIYLSANPNYYKGQPLLNSFAIHTFLTQESLVSALNSGAITATAELTPNDKKLITNSSINEHQALVNTGVYAFLNMNGIFSNRDLRKAIQKGINIEKIRSNIENVRGLNYPLIDSQITLENFPALPDYSPDTAKALVYNYLESKPENSTIQLVTINKGTVPTIADSFANELRNLGFNVNLSVYNENQDFITSTLSNREYDILIYPIELGSDPDLVAYYHSSQATNTGHNFSNYKNTIVDDIILSARETTDESTRVSKYETFLKYWVDDAPAIGLYQTNISYFYNRNVRSFSNDSRLVTALDRFSDIENWAVVKTTKNRTP